MLQALDGTPDDDDLTPDFAGMRPGAPPTLIYTDTPQDAMDRVVNEVAAIGAHVSNSLHALLVIYGNNTQKFALFRQLSAKIGVDKVWWLNDDAQKKTPPRGYGKDYLRMVYLDTATGLEGAVVLLVGVEDLFVAADVSGSSDEEQAERREEQARKLYMGMTRAGQRLVLVSSQRIPPAMERLFKISR